MDPVIRGRVERALDQFATNPIAVRGQIKRLKGDPALRLRVRDWRIAVLPEEECLMLLAASEGEEGDTKPEFLEELRRRRQQISDDSDLVPLDTLRRKA